MVLRILVVICCLFVASPSAFANVPIALEQAVSKSTEQAGKATDDRLAILIDGLVVISGGLCESIGSRPGTYLEYRLLRLNGKLRIAQRYCRSHAGEALDPGLVEYVLTDIGGEIEEIGFLIGRGRELGVDREERWRQLESLWRSSVGQVELESVLELESGAQAFLVAARAFFSSGEGRNAMLELAEGFHLRARSLVEEAFDSGGGMQSESVLVDALSEMAEEIEARLSRLGSGAGLGVPWSAVRAALRRLENSGRRVEILSGLTGFDEGLLSAGVSAGNAAPIGGLESCDENVISGWALDPDHPNRPVTVLVVVNGQVFRSLSANRIYNALSRDAGPSSRFHGFYRADPDFPRGRISVGIFAIDLDDGSQHLIGWKDLNLDPGG